MTWTASTESQAFNPELSWTGSAVSVAGPRDLVALGVQAGAQGYLWVQLAPPGPQHRGRLGLYIEESIENELEERGALAPGIQASTGLDASLGDQLYRARLVEMRGIALGIPSLEGITNLGRALDAEDSGVLRWWLAATAERPVRIIVSAENMRLRVYPSPVLFECLFDVAPEPVSPRAPSVSMAESSDTMALSDLPPHVHDLGAADELADQANPSEEAEADADDTMSFAEEPSPAEWAEFEAANASPSSLSAGVELPDLDRALGLDEGSSLATADADGDAEATGGHVAVASEPSLDDEAAEIEDHGELAAVMAAADAELDEEADLGPAGQTAAAGLAPRLADRLDPEEFLRALEEDSSRAPDAGARLGQVPAVRAPVAPPRVEPPADVNAESALPTKVIRRTPFIRMAEPDDEPAVEPSAPRASISTPESAPRGRGEASLDADAEGEALVERRPYVAPVVDENDPFVQLARREWKTWAKNLDATRGPKPLAVVERQFVTDYTRLREAVRRGVADQAALGVLDAWQESFSTSYSEAFDALRVRGKRPTMVLDVPEIAQRLGRLQGARRVQLLLVDGMRFDLGLMIQERLRARVDAALTERLLLWSALPSITTYQLELLGKGPEGLREECSLDESPALVARGRAASAPRRIRTGRLELFKIDVVEDSLRDVGIPVQERLPEIAERTSEALADHLSKQAPRTLVLVFGDHGFALDPKASGTTAEVRQGGSTPEEVLVPAFAWLTGAVH